MHLTPKQINEIAEQLDCGFRCYIHKQTRKMIFLPDLNSHPDMDTEPWEDDMERIDNNIGEYLVIEPPESNESFEIMERFAESLDEGTKLKKRLFWALSNRNPFRNFKNEIDYDGTHRQQWFDFKHECLKEWVIERVEIEGEKDL